MPVSWRLLVCSPWNMRWVQQALPGAGRLAIRSPGPFERVQMGRHRSPEFPV